MTKKKSEPVGDQSNVRAGGGANRGRGAASGRSGETAVPEDESFRVDDRRHWTAGAEADLAGKAEPRAPSIIEDYRQRTEQAESKLQEYIDAFKQHQREQDAFRERLERDVTRKVELKFSQLVAELLETFDTLELSLAHVERVPEAEPLAKGVGMARDGFLAILERHGVTRIQPDGEPFDPRESEALRVDPIDDPALDNRVTETLQPGFRLGELVIRPARVAVGRSRS